MAIEERVQYVIEEGMKRGETAGGAVQVTQDGKEVLFAMTSGLVYNGNEDEPARKADIVFSEIAD